MNFPVLNSKNGGFFIQTVIVYFNSLRFICANSVQLGKPETSQTDGQNYFHIYIISEDGSRYIITIISILAGALDFVFLVFLAVV